MAAPDPKLKRVFIANRGEIARRIATTARRLGMESVALTDRATPPAYLADVVTHFVKVEEETSAVYLDAARIVKLAKDSGADCVHPGFGFLSENAGFAASVEKAGLVWIGPNPKAIDGMASKATARDHAERARVPVVKGLSGFPVPESEKGDFSVLEKFADGAGYPLLIKAALGGGGKGMRLIQKKDELRAAALRARSEAVNSFGDGALICEQYLTSPRHVEVQILADKHGHAYAIGDRDCSVQRRHQKIIEEAPAIGLTDATRKALHDAAVSLAKAVGYDSTGTVEFLVDWAEPSKSAKLQRFYFLEMNTRLQVEHPVTEEVFGLDLVEWQFRVASGEKLPADFAAMPPRGHSVEVRIYAEDVTKNFFPAPGPVASFRQAVGPGLRWEVGLDEIDEVTGRFDPMVAKLIATGATRRIALERLAEGLGRTFFAGPACNMELLSLIATRSVFAEEAVTTHFLNEHMPSLLQALDRERQGRQALADEILDGLAQGRLGNVQAAPAGTDAASLTQGVFSLKSAKVKTQAGPSSGIESLSEATHAARRGQMRAVSGMGQIQRPGAPVRRFWYASLKTKDARQFWVSLDGHHFSREENRAASHQATGGAGVSSEIAAPVPGKVIAVNAEVGKELGLGDTVLVLESMKMEFEVKAARAGKLKSLTVKTGDQVSAGQVLAAWESE